MEKEMRKLRLVVTAAALIALAGCADDGYESRGFLGIDFGSSSSVWYDGYYGPYPGGYWSGGIFLYPDGRGSYRRDEGSHFRRRHFENAQRYKPARPPHDRGNRPNRSPRQDSDGRR